jgi:hypothetical protein
VTRIGFASPLNYSGLTGTTPVDHVFEGSVSEIFTLRDTIAQAVARAAWIEGSPHEQVLLTTPRPVNPQAYDAYLG